MVNFHFAAEEMFRKVKRAHEVLTDTEMRSKYDHWREGGISISFKEWLSLEARVHPVSETMFTVNQRN